MTRMVLLAGALLAIAFIPISFRLEGITVGSKKHTESVILGEMARLLVEDAGQSATHLRELGGTRLVFQSLLNGDIDIYPEYTGTIAEEILSDSKPESEDAIRRGLAEQGVVMSAPLGFNNTYAIAMLRSRAEQLGIKRISDLTAHPDLVFGFSNEFMDREDGWLNLKPRYQLPQHNVSGLDHDLGYRQLKLGAIDVIDAYSTDAKIAVHDLAILQDDLQFFPRYDAVLLYRKDLASDFPDVVMSITRLENAISESEMTATNRAVEVDRVSESRAAADHLQQSLGVTARVEEKSRAQRIWNRTLQHLDLVRKSLIPAILIAIPLGILAAKVPRVGQLILAIVGIVQTIPSLALLVILMPLVTYLGLSSVGVGSTTAIAALLLYSLLPIVRNTHAGLNGIASEHLDTAAALGLPSAFRLLRIELPLAARTILAGIKTAAVLNIGFATLGALIGAGGYGQPILTGIRLNETGLILEGAIPAAMLALLAQGAFEFAERYFVPKGLRLKREL